MCMCCIFVVHGLKTLQVLLKADSTRPGLPVAELPPDILRHLEVAKAGLGVGMNRCDFWASLRWMRLKTKGPRQELVCTSDSSKHSKKKQRINSIGSGVKLLLKHLFLSAQQQGCSSTWPSCSPLWLQAFKKLFAWGTATWMQGKKVQIGFHDGMNDQISPTGLCLS